MYWDEGRKERVSLGSGKDEEGRFEVRRVGMEGVRDRGKWIEDDRCEIGEEKEIDRIVGR